MCLLYNQDLFITLELTLTSFCSSGVVSEVKTQDVWEASCPKSWGRLWAGEKDGRRKQDAEFAYLPHVNLPTLLFWTLTFYIDVYKYEHSHFEVVLKMSKTKMRLLGCFFKCFFFFFFHWFKILFFPMVITKKIKVGHRMWVHAQIGHASCS